MVIADGIYRTLRLVHFMAVPHRQNGFISRLLMFLLDTNIWSLFGAGFQSFDILLLLFWELIVVYVTAYIVHTKSKYLIIFFCFYFLYIMLLLLLPYIFCSRFRPLNLFVIGLDLLLSCHHVWRLHSLMALSVFEGNMLCLNVNNIKSRLVSCWEISVWHLVLEMLCFSLGLRIYNWRIAWVTNLLGNHFLKHVVPVILPVIFCLLREIL